MNTNPKTVKQIMLEMAADKSNPMSKVLRACPCIQAELIEQGKLSLDELTDNEVNALSEHSFLEDWIDNQIVMQQLHISLRTLQTLRSNGTLPYTRVNGKIYYLRKDVEKMLRQNYGFKGGKK